MPIRERARFQYAVESPDVAVVALHNKMEIVNNLTLLYLSAANPSGIPAMVYTRINIGPATTSHKNKQVSTN
jgi:hypothetical protein